MRNDRQWAPAWLLTFPFRSSTNIAEADIVFVAAAASTCESTHTHTHAHKVWSPTRVFSGFTLVSSHPRSRHSSAQGDRGLQPCRFFLKVPWRHRMQVKHSLAHLSRDARRRRRRRVCLSVCPLEGAADTRIIAGTESDVVRLILNVANCYWIIVHKVFD